jgi:CRP/FNR family cyclic AMP-dependent transcriptional regulator
MRKAELENNRMSPSAKGQPSTHRIDKLSLLSAHPFFRDFASPIFNKMVSHAVMRSVKKGTVVFRKGDLGTNLCAVCKGSVRISVPSEKGQDAIFNVIPPGEVFGEIALLDGGARTADAVAIEDAELLIIDRRDFIPLVRENPDVAMKLIEMLCARLRRTSAQVEDIIFLGLPRRLAKALLQLNSDFRRHDGEIQVTQRDLSQMIGVSRESVNKLLRDWQHRGWLKLRRGSLKILVLSAMADIVSEMA